MKKFAASRSSFSLAFGAIVLLCVPAARAQTTIDTVRTYTYSDNQAIVQINNTYDGTGTTGLKSVYAGAQTTTGASLVPTTFAGYCVQLGTQLQHPETVAVGPLNNTFSLGKAAVNPGGDYGGAIGWLYSHFAPLAADQSEVSAQQSAALQLSVWAVEYNWDGTALNGIDPTLQTGNFTYLGNPTQTTPTITYDATITNAIRNDATAMLTQWNGQTDDNAASLLDGRTTSGGSGGQSLIGPKVVRAVPEPSALALLAGSPLAFGLAGVRRFRRA